MVNVLVLVGGQVALAADAVTLWHRWNLSLQRSMRSCCVKAGNLIMDAVIYSSHGRYMAPAGLVVGEGLVDRVNEERKERPPPLPLNDQTARFCFLGFKINLRQI